MGTTARDTPPTLRGDSLVQAVDTDADFEKLFASLEAVCEQAPTTEMSRAELQELFESEETTSPVIGPRGTPTDLPRSAILLKPEAPPHSMMARLGLLTRQRPLLVALGAIVGAVILVLFLMGAAKLVRQMGRTSELPPGFGWTSQVARQ